MERARLEGAGHSRGKLSGRLHVPRERPAGGLAAVLLVHVDAWVRAEVEALGEHLVGAGLAVLELDAPPDGRPPPDRAAVLDLEAALGALAEREEIDARRLAVVGIGRGGTLAFLAACASRRVAAAVDAGGPLARAELTAEHPLQPLELVHNLTVPLLVLLGADDPSTPPQEVARVEAALAQAVKSFELERVAGAGSRFLDPCAEGYHPATARAVRERIARFLRESLEPD